MTAQSPAGTRKFFTPAEANAMLPLVRAIVRDVTELAHDLKDRYERRQRFDPEQGKMTDAHQEELEHLDEAIEQGQDRLREYGEELDKLGILLKDYFTGLIDFPCWMNGHEVYLCWRLGEAEVAHWHEIDAGFSGRQKLVADVASR